MAYTPTTWEARIGTGLNNFTASGAVTGDVTLTPNPTAITQEGTAFTAARMNNIEQGIVGVANSTTRAITYTGATSANTVTSLNAVYAGNVVTIYGTISNSGSISSGGVVFNLVLTNMDDLLPSGLVGSMSIARGVQYVVFAQNNTDGHTALFAYANAAVSNVTINFGVTYVVA